MTVPRGRRLAVVAVAVVAALLAALLATYICAKLNARYLSDNAPYGDIGSYLHFQIDAFELWKREGLWSVIQFNLSNNIRDPLRFIFMATVDPYLFLKSNGHLVYHGALMALFLVLLAVLVMERTDDLLQVVLALICFALPLRAFSPIFGFGAAYPDMAGTLLYGCALYSLLLSRGYRLGWLISFGCFVGLLGLGRSVAVGYLAWLTLPLIVGYAVRNIREGRSVVAGIVVPLVAVAIPIVMIAGVYAWRMMAVVLQFYRVAGYGLMTTSSEIANAIRHFAWAFMGRGAILMLLLVFVFTLWRGGFFERPKWPQLLASLWIGVGHLLLAAFVLQTSDPLAILFAFPGLLLLAVAPMPWSDERRGTIPKVSYTIASSIVVFGIGCAVLLRALPNDQASGDPKLNQLYRTLADETHRLIEPIAKSRTPTIETAFWEYGRYIVVANLSRYRQYVAWRKVLQVHAAQWGLAFPGQNAEEIADRTYAKIKNEVDLFFVLEDPSAPAARPVIYADITAAIYENLNRRVRAETEAWTLEARVSSQWGDILIYRNRSRG